jgi:RNA polymerase sigma factor (sigma-70 family)
MTDPASSQITPLEQLQENEQHQILHDLMDTLSEKQRMVLKMFYFEGCSFDEIAESLEISLSDAKMQAHRGRKQLKTDLEEKLNDRPVGGHHE